MNVPEPKVTPFPSLSLQAAKAASRAAFLSPPQVTPPLKQARLSRAVAGSALRSVKGEHDANVAASAVKRNESCMMEERVYEDF